MNYLFRDLINREVVVVYIADILIFTKDMEEHNKVIEEVLTILKENDLFLKPEKCVWQINKVEYIGMIISDEGVHMAPEKVKVIQPWKEPKIVKRVRSFLGFAKIAKPLVELIKKNSEWSWISACQELVLAHPDPSQPMRVNCNASEIRTGAILQVKKAEDRNWHSCAYY